MAQKLCYDVFQKPVSEIKAERESEAASGSAEGTTTSAYNDKSLSVQVLNGGYTNGKASAVQNELLNAGYDVKSIGTYSGDKTDNTRIFVKKEGMGKKIQEQFPGSEIVVDPTTASDHDIVVVIGIKYE